MGTARKKYYESKRKNIKNPRIGNTCFTSIEVMGGRYFRNIPKNNNNVYKDEKELLLVIITLGTHISSVDTFFCDEVRIYNLGPRTHALNHLHGKCIPGPLEKVFHKITIWRGNSAVVSFILHIWIFHLYHYGDVFYNR